ncbi:MAG: class I SAM-dependent rRNA methyltransferase [candidate division WOR-3 bacterium]
MERCIVKGSEFQYLNHPWVYSGNVLECNAEKGSCVEVYTRKGVFLGSAIYNPESSIALRFYSRNREELNYFGIKERLLVAYEKRKDLFESPYYRLVYSESDNLPGLIVDTYGEGLVFQINSVGLEIRREDLIKALYDAFSPKFIVEKSAGFSRKQEGLPDREEIILNKDGLNLNRVIVEEGGFRFYVDIVSGQKTGFFYDQRRNREFLVNYFSGGLVLDVFSYIGTFSIMLAPKAEKVFAVDISSDALSILKENIRLNNLSEKKFVIETKDAFEFLKELAELKLKFDLVVLDPPSMVRRSKELENGIKAYINLLLDSVSILNRKGFIGVFSCSNHIKWDHVHEIVSKGTAVKGRSFRIIEYFHQDFRDHLVPAGFPEAEYLRGVLLKED